MRRRSVECLPTRVAGGARACPPENAAGSAAYQDFLERWENDPYGEETEALIVHMAIVTA